MPKKATLSLASSGETDPLSDAISEAQSRLDALTAEHGEMVQQLQAIRSRGVEVETAMIAIRGELKALTALQGKA